MSLITGPYVVSWSHHSEKEPFVAEKPDDAVPPVPEKPAAKKPAAKKPAAAKPAATPVEPAPAVPVAPAAAHQPNPYAASSPASPPQNPYSVQPTYAPGPPRGLAITSMILGICGVTICCLTFLPSLAAVITGHIAQRSQPYAKPFWLTGIITGYAGIAVAVLYWLVVLVSIIASATYDYSY